jgi:hypothetical protein
MCCYHPATLLACTLLFGCAARRNECPPQSTQSEGSFKEKSAAIHESDRQEYWTWIGKRVVPATNQTDVESFVSVELSDIKCSPTSMLAKATLHNRSERWLWVRAPVTLGTDSSLVLSITRTISEQKISESVKSESIPSLADYVRLGPGGAISSPVVLVWRFGASINETDVWRIVATYRDGSDAIPKPPPGTLWFFGASSSNAVEVRVSKVGSEVECKVVHE